MSEVFDVVIIGGGPAGSTCATMLCRKGYRVLVLEREQFPRFHIGESLTAFAADAFKTLGVYEELKAINYVQKTGLEFVLPEKSTTVYFPEDMRNEPDEKPWAFQMARSKLDMVLLNNAQQSGADVRQQHAVREVLFEGDRAVGVSFRRVGDHSSGANGHEYEVRSKWVVDTTGQSGLMNRQLEDNCNNDTLLEDKLAVFSHWEGDIGITNADDEANFKLCVHPNHRDWAWFLPIDRDMVSLGVVLDKQSVKKRNKSLEALFDEYAHEIPFISDFLTNRKLKRVEKFRGVQDFSYRSRQYYGNGWALTGDAAGFLDPIFSTGLQIAFNSAFQLADTLDEALREESTAAKAFEDYAATLDRFYRINATLVYWFYECGIDPEKAQKPWNLLTKTHWSSPKHLLAFLWHGSRVITRSKKEIRTWGREVLFGNVRRGNRIADLFLVLAQNYETRFAEKLKDAKRRSFNELET